MAEGLLRFFGNDDFDVSSAGSDPHGMNPHMVQVMGELGIDIAPQRSKHLNEFRDQSFDYVITLCDPAHEECPAFPGDPERIQWRYPDPAAVVDDEEAQLRAFRKVRDEMSERLRLWILNQRKLLRERDASSDLA
jgi:arsenate reductase